MPSGSPIFTDNDKLQELINEYFLLFGKQTTEEQREAKGIMIYENRPTITGLALFLGFESRQSLYDYEKKADFAYSIKRARVRIENIYENMLNHKNSATGSIFALKNFGWKDTQDINMGLNRAEDIDKLFPPVEGETDNNSK